MVCFFYFESGETIETPFDICEAVKAYGLSKCANAMQWAYDANVINEQKARDLLRALSEVRRAQFHDGFAYVLR